MQRGTSKIGQQGFTLIEVLVTVIIMAVGMLGVAGLQLAGMRSNHSAYLRTQATIAAYDLMDRMRADPKTFEVTETGGMSAAGAAIVENWAIELERMGLTLSGDPLTAANCSNSDGKCQVTVRWDDSRGEDTKLQTGGRTGISEFSFSTRLAQ